MTLARLVDARFIQSPGAGITAMTPDGELPTVSDSIFRFDSRHNTKMNASEKLWQAPITSHRFGLFLTLFLFAVVLVEQLLAQANRFRGYLDQLVIFNIGQRLFQRHPDRRRETDRFIL